MLNTLSPIIIISIIITNTVINIEISHVGMCDSISSTVLKRFAKLNLSQKARRDENLSNPVARKKFFANEKLSLLFIMYLMIFLLI